MQLDVDIAVIGGGVAGLSAAIAARKRGASVRLLESAPASLRGGNARHARNFRAAHGAPNRYSPGVYGRDEFVAELKQIGGVDINAPLARSLIDDSQTISSWLADCGVRLQDPQTGVLPYSRRTVFLLGGGKAMVNALYQTAARIGVDIVYGSEVIALDLAADSGWRMTVICDGEQRRLSARCLVAAAGGPRADLAQLRAQYASMADEIAIRGCSHSDGRLMQVLMRVGARTVGDPASCHMVAVDARGPKFDGGIITRVTAIPYGLVVDRDCTRVDIADREIGRSHYAQWGHRIACCHNGLAYLILDAEGVRRSAPFALEPIGASSLAALAGKLGLDEAAFARVTETFNADPPPAAGPLMVPPFLAVPLRAGLTFVHYGIAVDERMRVMMRDGIAMESLFAAGMIMVANVLRRGYLAGFGLTVSTISGRRAGEAAASHVLE